MYFRAITNVRNSNMGRLCRYHFTKGRTNKDGSFLSGCGNSRCLYLHPDPHESTCIFGNKCYIVGCPDYHDKKSKKRPLPSDAGLVSSSSKLRKTAAASSHSREKFKISKNEIQAVEKEEKNKDFKDQLGEKIKQNLALEQERDEIKKERDSLKVAQNVFGNQVSDLLGTKEKFHQLEEMFAAIKKYSEEMEINKAIDSFDEKQTFCKNVCDMLGIKKKYVQLDQIFNVIKTNHTSNENFAKRVETDLVRKTAEIQQKMDNMRQKHLDSEIKNHELQQTLEKLEMENLENEEKANKTIEEKEKAVVNKTNHIKSLNQKIGTIQKENSELRQGKIHQQLLIDDMQISDQEKSKQIDELKVKIMTIEEEFEHLNSKKEKLSKITFDAKDHIISNHVNDIKVKAEQIHYLKLELAEVIKEKTDLANENLKLARSNQEKEDELVSLRQKLKESSHENQQEAKEEKLKAQMTELEALNSKLEDEKTALEKINKDLSISGYEKDKELNALRQKNLDNNDKLKVSSNQIQELTVEKYKLKVTVRENDDLLVNLRAENTTLTHENEKLSNSVKELQRRIEKERDSSDDVQHEKELNRAIEEERDALDEGQHNFCNNVCDLLGLKKRVIQLDELLTFIKDNHALKEKFEATVKENEDLLINLKAENSTLIHEKEKLSDLVKEQERKINNWRQINQDDNVKLKEYEHQINQIKGEKIAKDQIITNHVNDIRGKAEQIQSLKVKLEKINQDKTTLAHENLKLTSLVKEKEEELIILSQKESERNNLQEEEKVKFETILKEKVEKLNNLRKKNLDNNGKNINLIQKITAEKTKLEAENKTLLREKEELHKSFKEQEEQLNNLRLKDKENNQKMSEIEAIVKDKEDLNSSLKIENDRLLKSFKDQGEILNNLKLKDFVKYNDLNIQHEGVKKKLEEKDVQLRNAEEKFEKICEENISLVSEFEDLKVSYENLKDDHNAQCKENGDLQDKIAAIRVEEASLKQSLEDKYVLMEKERDELDEKNHILGNQFQSQKTQLEKLIRENKTIKNEYSNYMTYNEKSYAELNFKYKKVIEDILPKLQNFCNNTQTI